MNVLAVISPGLKVLFERVGKPEVINRPDFFSGRRDGGGHRLQSRWLGRQPMDGLRRLPKTAALYVKAGAFRFDAVTMGLGAVMMGLGARRFRSD
jgi:hypothetical protein